MFLSKALYKRSWYFVPNYKFSSRVLTFDKLESIQDHLADKQPTFCTIFVKAAWNPQCAQAEKDFDELSNKYGEMTFIKIDGDADVRSKQFFGVKYEPEFIVTCLGAEMTRQVGNNKKLLEQKFAKVYDELKKTEFVQGTKKWEPFNARFNQEYNAIDKDFDYWSR